ncbi:SRPBCC family protein [Thauera sinica]|nr:SRPBCC family protein [Thauera sp. K11]ATE60795.1 hypothetical protein CCZ27_13335 [Thauera sp. K11]
MIITTRHLVLAAACGVAAGGAPAHGPARLKIEHSVDIQAPADKVWARIGDFQDMSWHPAVAGTRGSGGNAPQATRLLTLKGDGKATIEEALNKYSAENMSYMYKITNVDVAVLPVTNYASTITVTPTGPASSKVEWRGGFYRGFPNNDPPPDLNDDAAIKAVTGIYQSGLEALKSEMEKGGR